LKTKLLYLITLIFITGSTVFADNRYWVGGTGAWTDSQHWASTSGGASGASVPTMNDDVFFDQHSFTEINQTVMLTADGVCKSIDWSAIDRLAIFSSALNKTLTIYGNYKLSPLLLNGFKGQTIFASTNQNNTIHTFNRLLIGDWIFNGSGSWLLQDDVSTEKNVTIELKKGILNTNNKTITCGFFKGNSNQVRTLNLTSSEIYVKNTWDFDQATNLTFISDQSRIIFDTLVTNQNFKSGNLSYNSVSAIASPCTPSSQPCASFTITLTATNVTCAGSSNGTATAIINGGTGPFTYQWNSASPIPCGQNTSAISCLGLGNYSVMVTDQGTGSFCFCNINVNEPSLLFTYQLLQIQPTCNGLSNGTIIVDATGGNFPPPYSYSWTGGLAPNDTVTNVASGTYTVTVTDINGCTATNTITLNQPAVLVSPGTSTNVTCNGFCNGTASVNASGGTSPYTYSWAPGNPIGQGTASVTNLCPGTYTCTVTDLNGCTSTYITTITQPPLLTLAMSQVNASCGGVCDASATATLTGGTAPYIYVWTTGASTSTASLTNTISSLCAGGYTVQVTDAQGCFRTDSVTITEPPILLASAIGTDISCFNACNGTATAVVTGGTVGYTYFWSPGIPTGQGTATISNLCPGTYTVLVTDANLCTDTGMVTITQPAVLAANPTATDVLCFGDCNGTAAAAPSGGTAPYSYNWTPGNPTGDGTANVSGLCAGVWTVLVTDSNGCTSTQSATVNEPTQIQIVMTKTDVTCNGACNGTATATPSGGTPGYTYSWSNGQTTQTATGLCPGTYTVTVTDNNGCTRTNTISIIQPNPLLVNVVGTSLACFNDCDAVATATISGGTPLYTIVWSGNPTGQGTTTISGLCSGTYTINVTDANNCPATANVTINQPTQLVLNTSSTNVTCFGLCNGTASAIGGGGTPPYTFSWAPGGQTTPNVSNLCAGTYTVTIRDANNCTQQSIITITQPTQVLPNATVVNNVSCSGLCNGSATAAPTGGTGPYTFVWSPGNPTGQGTSTITNLCAGNYNVQVTDFNGCVQSQSVTITQPTPLSAPITGNTSSCNICNGSATVTPAGGTGPYTFLWAPTGQITPTATGLCPNITYTVTVTDANGCVATNTVTILQTIIINITTSSTTLSCFGACNGIATANPSGGTIPYSFQWVNSVPATVDTSQTATGLCAGSYTVTVSDAAGCFNAAMVTFTNPPLLTATASVTNATCGGSCNGTATANPLGGTGAYTYSWNTVPVQTTQTATGLCAGNYTVTVTDANGCTTTVNVTITEPTTVIDNVSITTANCTFADGIISVAPTGGTLPYTFAWGPGNPTGNGTSTITGLLPGTYTLVITDGGGCSFNFSYLLNNTQGPTTTISHTNVTCNNDCDGTATVVASGGAPGYTYSWTPGTPTGQGTSVISALCGTTTYTVQVTDAAGCITFDTATVINPALISPNPTIVNESCGGACDGSISLAPTGGTGAYSYLWNTGATTSSISNLCAGSYTVTVTDVNGCDSVLVITITSPPLLTVSLASTNVLCNAACNGTATATIGGGTPPYTVSWSHGAAFILPNVTNLCPGTYTITVTDSRGCTATASTTITEPTALTSTTTQTNTSCNGVCDGTATVIPSGGTIPYTAVWNPGALAGFTASNLCAGTYNVIVTDGNGCTNSPASVIITQPAPILPTVTFTNPTCNAQCNGTATANPTGGSGVYTYLWMPGNLTTQSINGLCAGSYTLTVTDSLGCSGTQIISIVAPATLSSNTSATSPSCANGCNGSVTANPVGGTAAFTYLWTPGNFVTQTVNNLCVGVYTVTTTDANGCTNVQTATILNRPGIDVTVGSTPAACGFCDGTINITPITGTPAFTFAWTPVLPPSATQSNLCAGLYTVTVTDLNGCDSTFTIGLNNSSGATGETVTTQNATCNTFCDGSGSIIPIGGVAPFTYLWNDGPPPTADSAAINLCAGNYLVQVTDNNTCIHFSPVSINEPAPILANASITSAVCAGVCTGAITTNVTGGTPGYSYLWMPGAMNTPNVSNLCPGTYTLTITDGNLCTQQFTFVIGQTTPLSVAISSNNITCSNACTGLAFVSIATGTAPFAIQWNDPLGQTNDTASALCAGNYTVTVTDALGCTSILQDTITATPAIAANPAIVDAGCGLCDGSATLTPTGGTPIYTYLWSNGQTTPAVSNLCAGLYTVDIIDGNGCTTNFSIPVSNPAGPTSATISSTNVSCNNLCNGAVTAVTPIGGTAPYSFLWVHNGQTTATQSNLCAGTYFLQITDANGCSFVQSIVITEPPAIVANQTIIAASCGLCDGSITVTPSGGTAPYNLLWNTGATTLSLANLCAGIYSVQITDAAGCVANITVPLNSQNAPSLLASATDISCNGTCNGTATVIPSGASPFTFLWNTSPTQSTQTISALCEGVYFVQVTDNNGCIGIASATVNEPSSIGFSLAVVNNPLCNGNTNGSITAIPSGGTIPYTYAWTSGGTNASETNLAAGSYTVTITDANGCTASQTTILTNPTSLTISNSSVSPTCNTTANGSIDVTVVGGTTPYSYQWSGASTATTEDLTAILNGTYFVNVLDVNGCAIADTIILLPIQTVIADAGNDTTYCQSGALTLTATSTNGISYQWFELPGNTSVGNTASVIVNPTGTTDYYVVVDNGTGCTSNDTISVTANPLPNVNAGPDHTIVIGTNTLIGGMPTSSTAGSAIVWTPSTTLNNSTAPNPIASPTVTTTYTVTVTSPQGCISIDSTLVTVLPTIVFPDGFSPNGDGVNDEWIIDGIETFPNCTVEVYNRWGELLFQSPGYKEKWNGTYKGQALPVGTYYYIIDLGDPLFPDAYTGPITILR